MLDKQIKKIIEQLYKLVTDAKIISHIATTRDHYYFTAYDEFFNHDISIRVDRYTGLIQQTILKDEDFGWVTIGQEHEKIVNF